MKGISRGSIVGTAAMVLLGVSFAFVARAATEINVVTSGTFTPAYQELVPEYERATHNKIITEFGGSMGTSPNTITNRLKRGEVIDVVIMAAPALDDMIQQGKVRAGSRVDLVKSKGVPFTSRSSPVGIRVWSTGVNLSACRVSACSRISPASCPDRLK